MAQEDVVNGSAVEKSVGSAVEKSVSFTAFKPQLFVEAQKVGEAVTFYKSAFGAVEAGHSLYPKRKADQELPHALSAELELAGSTIVVRDVSSESDSTGKTGVSTVTLCLETDDVEGAIAKSVAAGAVKVGEVSEVEADGGLKGKVTDPFGFSWVFSSAAKKTTENDENKEV